MKRATKEELQDQIKAWNDAYPVGTKVLSDVYPEKEHETRTEAMILFNQKAVIYLKDYNGYFDLDEIHPVEEKTASGPPP